MKKEGGKIHPDRTGMVVTDLLVENFDHIFDMSTPRGWKRNSTRSKKAKSTGAWRWRSSTSSFEKDLEHAERNMTDIKRMEKPTDLVCEKCGKPMVIKWGRHGSFIACTGYPGMHQYARTDSRLPDGQG